MIKNVIFDFDGTICDSFPVIFKIYQEFAPKYHLPVLGKAEKEIIRSHHPAEIMKKLQIPMYKLLFYLKAGREEFKKKIVEVEPFREIPHLLTKLNQKKIRLGIVSSDSRSNILTVLNKHQLTAYFEFIHTELNLFGKDKVLKKVIQKYNLNPTETYYVGDEVRDIEAAHKAGLKIIAVSWGFNSHQFLKTYKPEYIADKPEKILNIINPK